MAKRFASDLPLLNQQVRPSDLPPSDRALRMWAFFVAYTEAAARPRAHTPEGQELFDKALEKEGFGELRDKHTGQDGVKVGKWVLLSGSPEEAKERAEQVELEPPPEVLLSEAAQAQKEPKGPPRPPRSRTLSRRRRPRSSAGRSRHAPETPHPTADAAATQEPQPEMAQPRTRRTPSRAGGRRTGLGRAEGQRLRRGGRDRQPKQRTSGPSELVRMNPQQGNVPPPVIQPPQPHLLRRPEDEEQPPGRFEDAWRSFSGNLRLGNNMLWNALHRMRNDPMTVH